MSLYKKADCFIKLLVGAEGEQKVLSTFSKVVGVRG